MATVVISMIRTPDNGSVICLSSWLDVYSDIPLITSEANSELRGGSLPTIHAEISEKCRTIQAGVRTDRVSSCV